MKNKTCPSFIIDSRKAMEEAALKFGILPFFPNPVRGLSIEEMTTPGLLFGGNAYEGCWEWKGPVIRQRNLAYGKFFRRKAGFVSLELLPDFLNYRRSLYPVSPDSTEEMLLDIIGINDSMTSTELKASIFGTGRRPRQWYDLPDIETPLPPPTKRKSLEGPLQRLQMGGWLLISDFEYKITRSGERYGWGVARYSTPEQNFGDKLHLLRDKSPDDSLETLISALSETLPGVPKAALIQLLK